MQVYPPPPELPGRLVGLQMASADAQPALFIGLHCTAEAVQVLTETITHIMLHDVLSGESLSVVSTEKGALTHNSVASVCQSFNLCEPQLAESCINFTILDANFQMTYIELQYISTDLYTCLCGHFFWLLCVCCARENALARQHRTSACGSEGWLTSTADVCHSPSPLV